MVTSQSALIDYTLGHQIQILQRKSNCHIVYSNTTRESVRIVTTRLAETFVRCEVCWTQPFYVL